jgi:hypothetical protein
MGRTFILHISRGTLSQEYVLNQPVTSIGRRADNAIVLDDSEVSRRHAEVELTGGSAQIIDLGSSNGTLVNGVKIEPDSPQEIKEGDTISIGDYTIVVHPSPVLSDTSAPSPSGTIPPVQATVITEEVKKPEERRPARIRGKLLAVIGGVIALIIIAVLVIFLMPPGAKDQTELQSELQSEQYEVATVKIPVDIKESKDIGSLHFEVVYDWSILSAIEVEYGALADDAILEYSVAAPGRVIVEIISSSGISGNLSIASIIFRIGKDTDVTIPIDVENVVAYNVTDLSEIQASATAGSYTGDGTCQPPTLIFSGTESQ